MLRFLLCDEDRKAYGLGDEYLSFDAAGLEELDADGLIDIEEYLGINIARFEEDLAAHIEKRSGKALKAMLWLGCRGAGCRTSLSEFNPRILKAKMEDAGGGGGEQNPPVNRAGRRATKRAPAKKAPAKKTAASATSSAT